MYADKNFFWNHPLLVLQYRFGSMEGTGMQSGKIAIIENLGGNLGEYCYRRIAMRYSDDYKCFPLIPGDGFPEDTAAWASKNELSALIIDGSTKSPLCQDKWIRAEEEFIRDFMKLKIPMLGICFGHQVLASALGSELSGGRKLRVELDEVKILDEDPIFDGFGGTTLQLYSHRVQVATLPEGFIHLASAAECEISAMRHPSFPCYGVQFHPEMDPEIKVHDPSWNPISDEDFGRGQGTMLLLNFKKIIKRWAQDRSAAA